MSHKQAPFVWTVAEQFEHQVAFDSHQKRAKIVSGVARRLESSVTMWLVACTLKLSWKTRRSRLCTYPDEIESYLGYGHRPPSKPLAEAQMEGAYFLLLRPGVTVVVIARAGEKCLVVFE